jgi:hypothetical protein
VDRWNRRLATGRHMLWSPTIRAAPLAGTPWLDMFCPGCGMSRAIDLRTIAQAFRTQTGLCRYSNRSLFTGANSAGKKFGEARDRGGIFGDASRFLATETMLSRVSGGKPRNVKDYSDGARKSKLRRNAWLSWQDSNPQASDYGGIR